MLEQIRLETDTQMTQGNLSPCLSHPLLASYKIASYEIGMDNKL